VEVFLEEDEIQTFLEPVFEAIVNEDEWQKVWNFITKWDKKERSLES